MIGKLDCYGLSDIGQVRKANEDQFLISDLVKSLLIHHTSLSHEDHTRLFGNSQGQLLLVADGMGGHAAGKQASTIAVQSLTRYVLNTMPWFFRLNESLESDRKEELVSALEECQRSIEVAAEGSAANRGMGTTLTMAYVIWPRLYIVHVGDSRCYLFRQARLEQITTDHTVAQQYVEHGALTPEQARESRWSHVLWNCVGGGSSSLKPEVYKATLEVGDTLLLCTDGLSGPVSDQRISALLQEDRGAQETCRRLVSLANEGGGKDNITVVVARFRESNHEVAQAEEQATLEIEPSDLEPSDEDAVPATKMEPAAKASA